MNNRIRNSIDQKVFPTCPNVIRNRTGARNDATCSDCKKRQLHERYLRRRFSGNEE